MRAQKASRKRKKKIKRPKNYILVEGERLDEKTGKMKPVKYKLKL